MSGSCPRKASNRPPERVRTTSRDRPGCSPRLLSRRRRHRPTRSRPLGRPRSAAASHRSDRTATGGSAAGLTNCAGLGPRRMPAVAPGMSLRMGERLVADVVVERLQQWSVARIFGHSGDGINAVMGALRRAGNPEFVQARHEEAAAFMAVGHAKYTGGVGVVVSTQRPGAVHLLNGLYDAKLDNVPVVAVVGQQERTVLGSAYQQGLDLQTLSPAATQYVQTVVAAEHALMVIDRAFRSALATRQPCAVVLPHDVQKLPVPEPLPQQHGVVISAPEWRRPRVRPQGEDLRDAADLLNDGRKVALLVGQGARHAGAQVRAVADRLGAGITTSLLGKPWV